MGRPKKPSGKDFWCNPADDRHGTANGYCNLGCHCDRCKDAWADCHLEYMHTHAEQREKASDANFRRRGVERRVPYIERPERWRDLDWEYE